MSALGHTTKCYTPTDLLNVASHSLFKLSGCRDAAKSGRGRERDCASLMGLEVRLQHMWVG